MKRPHRFSFDPAKNSRNVAERGIDFALTETAFEFETAMVAVDDRRDYGEVREVAAGFIGQRLHTLVFTMREGDTCHTISLRKSNKREIEAYVEKLSENT